MEPLSLALGGAIASLGSNFLGSIFGGNKGAVKRMQKAALGKRLLEIEQLNQMGSRIEDEESLGGTKLFESGLRSGRVSPYLGAADQKSSLFASQQARFRRDVDFAKRILQKQKDLSYLNYKAARRGARQQETNFGSLALQAGAGLAGITIGELLDPMFASQSSQQNLRMVNTGAGLGVGGMAAMRALPKYK